MKKQLQMKGAAALLVGISLSFTGIAQTNTNSNTLDASTLPAKRQAHLDPNTSRVSILPLVKNPKTNGAEAVLWTEDFANGFAASTNGAWTTGGVNANFVEYDTDGPDNLVALNNGWGPLPSPTAGNGFAIFDFYDRFPDAPGTFASTAAEASLTSPVINLGAGTTDAQIDLYMQLFHCCHATDKNMTIQISTDGGLTFPNEIVANAAFDRNERHWTMGLGYHFRWKISSAIVADPTNVVIRFDWTSVNPDVNAQFDNTYFWMIDDITISNVPDHSIEFTETSNGAPAHDIIFDGDGGNSKHGIMALGQSTPIGFDANVVNYGTVTQTDVKLQIEIFDDNNTLLQTLTSANGGTIAENDTLDFNTLFSSTTWTPSAAGIYNFVYTVTSDSSNVPGFEVQSDTFTMVSTNNTLHSIDWGAFSNNVGTEELGDDGSALASRLYYPNPNVLANTNHIYLENVDIRFSTASAAGGEMLFQIQDTSIDLNTGFNLAPMFSETYDVTAAMVGATGTFDLRDSLFNTWSGVYEKFGHKLSSNESYYMVAYLFSNGGASPVQIANDQTFDQPGLSSVMYETSQARWFTGFQNSLTVNAPWIRPRFAATPDGIGLEENAILSVSAYPNPVSGNIVNINFPGAGTYSLELMTLSGQLVKSESLSVNGNETQTLDVSDLASGVYLLNVAGDNATESIKLTVQ